MKESPGRLALVVMASAFVTVVTSSGGWGGGAVFVAGGRRGGGLPRGGGGGGPGRCARSVAPAAGWITRFSPPPVRRYYIGVPRPPQLARDRGAVLPAARRT